MTAKPANEGLQPVRFVLSFGHSLANRSREIGSGGCALFIITGTSCFELLFGSSRLLCSFTNNFQTLACSFHRCSFKPFTIIHSSSGTSPIADSTAITGKSGTAIDGQR